MIRSAKMKLITPPKLIPPFHSTAASGTFPIEQTKEKMEITGPSSGPQILASSGCPVKNRCLPEAVGHPGGQCAGDEQPEHDVAQHRRPLHHEYVGDRGESLG